VSVIKDKEGVRVSVWEKMIEDRILFITGTIDDELANYIIANMLYLANQDSSKPITLYINSPGGVITSGLAIYNTMELIKCPVNTIGYGMCASIR